MTPEQAHTLIGLLDLTSLNDSDTGDTIHGLCERALIPAGPVAAVCVWPRFVALSRRLLDGSDVRVAAVINFPSGDDDAAAVALATRGAVADGADEVDVVMPWQALLAGQIERARSVLAACRKAAGDGVVMKVILESGHITDPAVLRTAALLAIACGADFLKTSTGKLTPGATLPAVEVFFDAIAAAREVGVTRPVGIKPSGGIRTPEQAQAYVDLAESRMGKDWVSPATFRLGASSLLDSLIVVTEGG